MSEFGLALGGGGVKGLAHIALLKKLDRLELKPTAIAGTSIGAILGALYASGLSGAEIESRVTEHIFSRRDGLKKIFAQRKHLFNWLKVFGIEKSRGGIISADGLFEHLFDDIIPLEFSNLNTPFTAVATCFHTGQAVALESGPLYPAVRASMAVPGIFAPVSIDGRLLVDGGLVNNVPSRYVAQDSRPVIASDVICLPKATEPDTKEAISGAMSIVLRAMTQHNYAEHKPELIFEPDTSGIEAFDLHKIGEALERGEYAAERFDPGRLW